MKKKTSQRKAEQKIKKNLPLPDSNSWPGPIAIIAVVSLLFVWPLFLPSLFRTHDDFGHIIRLSQFISALKDGQFPVRWLPDLMGGYGLPVYVIYPPLPSSFAAVCNLFGLGVIGAYKAVYVSVIPLSGIAMFLYAREWLDKKGALLAAVAYMCAPSHFLTIYVKGGFNEALSFIFIPLIFLGVKRTTDTGSTAIPLLAVSTAGLALSHSISTLLTVPWIIAYALIMVIIKQKYRSLISTVSGLILGLGISSVYWLVAFVEKDLTTVSTTIGGLAFDYRDHFVRIRDLLAPSWDYGYSGITEPYQMSFQIGSLFILALIISLIAVRFVKDRSIKAHLLFFQIMAFLCIAMMVKWSAFIWDIVPLVEYAQFPWRFLNLLAFPAACMMGALTLFANTRIEWYRPIRLAVLSVPAIVLLPFFVIEKSPEKISFYNLELALFVTGAVALAFFFRKRTEDSSRLVKTAVGMIILTSLLISNPPLHHALWKRPFVIHDIDTLKRTFSPGSVRERMEPGTSLGHLFLPKTVTRIPVIPPRYKIEVLRGNVELSALKSRSTSTTFMAEAVRESELLINTFYFPGWNAYIDGEKVPVKLDDYGRMKLILPQGIHAVALLFEDTPVRRASKIISAIGLGLLALLIVFIKKNRINRIA
jgi:hypothetical protein